MSNEEIDNTDIKDFGQRLEKLISEAEEQLNQPDQHGKLHLQLDIVFFRVFDSEHNHRLLIGLLNALLELPEGERIRSVDRLESRKRGTRAGDKNPALDLLVRDQLGRLIQIELQLLNYPYYMKRAVYYLTCVHAEQLREGESYERLARTVGIHLLSWTLLLPLTQWPEPVSRVRMCELETKQEVTDQLELLFVELPKFRKSPASLNTEREKWLYYLKHANTLSREDVLGLNLKILDEVDEKLWKVSRREELRYAYLGEMKAYLDALNFRNYWQSQFLKEGIEQGLQQGIEQGLQQGIEKGLQQGIEKGLQQGIEKGLQQGIEKGLQQGIEKGLQQGIEKGLQQGIEKGIEQGLQQGIEKGIEQGIEQGLMEGQRTAIVELLTVRFGVLPESTLHKLNQLSELSVLKQLLRDSLSAPNLEALGLH